MPNPLDCRLILASKSPRRSQLLEQAGFRFEVRTQDVGEEYEATTPVLEISEMLAVRKARAAKHYLSEGDVILAADSLVIHDGEIFEKPTDAEDARRMLRRLSDSVHTVTTGVCLLSAVDERQFTGTAMVYCSKVTDAEIDFYLEKYQPYDKAGAYGIQEWFGLCKIHRIEGTYPSVMGLPTDLVYSNLAQMAW